MIDTGRPKKVLREYNFQKIYTKFLKLEKIFCGYFPYNYS